MSPIVFDVTKSDLYIVSSEEALSVFNHQIRGLFGGQIFCDRKKILVVLEEETGGRYNCLEALGKTEIRT